MDMLTLSHLSKSFGSKKIIDDLSFTVPEHSIFGFIGQNGAGKTTTMKMILGLLQADSGKITVNGETVRYGQNRTNRIIGYLSISGSAERLQECPQTESAEIPMSCWIWWGWTKKISVSMASQGE